MWKSIRSGYIKSLDVGFYYSLKNPVARRLYRLLDKRFWGKSDYEFDVFDLASKLGMVRYKFPAEVRKKLQPAISELIARGFLLSAEPIRIQGYSRLRFVKCSKMPATPLPLKKEDPEPAPQLPKIPDDTSQTDLDPEAPVVSGLIAIGMAAKAAQRLVHTYAAEQIHNWLDAMQWEQAQGKAIKSPAAYLRRALEEGWPLPVHFKTRAQRAEAEAEKERKRVVYTHMLASQEAQEQSQREQEKQQRTELMARMQTQYQTTAEEKQAWEAVRAHVASQPGFEELELLLPGTYLLSLREGIASLGVFHAFHVSQWRSQTWLIKKAFQDLGYKVRRVTLELPKGSSMPQE